ncbi:MAG TPA: three-Cys-motif partner protein TcmP [Arcobacter sp.]|nr:three-Cys-motif partner protein TcmP [Arcobacter sp.]
MGSKIKQGEKDYLKEHSKEKVAFYKKYLDLYLTVLLHSPYTTRINIYDIFCGVGVYSGDRSKGSPVVAMESIQDKFRGFPNNSDTKQISLTINDGDESRVNTAKKYIENNCNISKCSFTAKNYDAKEIFPYVINDIQSKQKSEHHFIFIDPHGYKDIYKRDIISLMEAGKSEILIFLPIHLMYRFLKPTKLDEENRSYLPLRRFMEEFGLEYNAQTPKEYIKHIEEAFLCDEKYFTTSYVLQADSNNYYALFFITKNLRGLEKAVITKWDLDELCGEGLEKEKAPSLFETLEKEDKKENCLNILEAKLKIFLSIERTNNEIFKFTLLNGFLLKHSNDILKQFQVKDLLEFDRKVRKGSFYLKYENYKHDEVKYKVKMKDE